MRPDEEQDDEPMTWEQPIVPYVDLCEELLRDIFHWYWSKPVQARAYHIDMRPLIDRIYHTVILPMSVDEPLPGTPYFNAYKGVVNSVVTEAGEQGALPNLDAVGDDLPLVELTDDVLLHTEVSLPLQGGHVPEVSVDKHGQPDAADVNEEVNDKAA